jgi:predicted ATPase
MLTQLQIQNFKGWKDTGSIRMAPITLFFGANSSGKSSIGQFLMLLKQTVESQDRKAVLYPGGKNSAVQLGSFKDMVYGREAKDQITFQYEWTLPAPLVVTDPLRASGGCSGDAMSFEAEIGLLDPSVPIPSVRHFNYRLHKDGSTVLSIEMRRKPKEPNKFQTNATGYTLVRNPGRAWSPGAPVRFYGFPDEVVAYHQNADFVQSLNFAHEKLFRSVAYLGPMRTKAERLYSWSGTEPESVGYIGENTIPAMLAAKTRKLSLGHYGRKKPFEEIVATKLKNMGLIESFQVKQISKNRQDYEVKVKTKGSIGLVDLPDIGFGVSQVLPVLVECFYAPANSIILMEQPEIHLHPRAQSLLADVMIDVINAREDGQDRNIQLIIETHSEHFLRRLQRRIAEDTVKKEQVAAYFADVSKTPAQLEELRLDIFGNIENWPKDFFGDEMEDIAEQSKAALRKRMKAAKEKRE